MKILILSQYYPPETGACAHRIEGFARKLCDFGHEVSVVTGFPNYPRSKLYPGYVRRWCTEEQDGKVRLFRTWLAIGYPTRPTHRLINYLSFFVSSLWACLWRVGTYDVIVATSGPILVGFTGALVSVIKRRPFVLDLRDAWPERIVAAGEFSNPFAIRILERVETFMYSRAKKIICVTQGLKIRLVSKGVESSKLDVVTNGTDTELFQPQHLNGDTLKEFNVPSNGFVLIYSGTLGLLQDHDLVLSVAERLSKYEDIYILIVGDGVRHQYLLDQKKKRGLQRFYVRNSMSRKNLASIFGSAHVGINSNTPNQHNCMAIPVKMFDYMACGLPFVIANHGEVETIVRESGAGFCTEPGDVDQFTECVLKLYHDRKLGRLMGQRGRELVVSEYSLDCLTAKFQTTLSGVCEKVS